ncbi:uncharacterized protein (TIGR02646 family) [Phyllobacterium trifolii]|uniref:Uncharacterized protein (TIGR02646 family) n=1 Tax=Phyllobacterium trifolii TaxID=300193 RepID=A0A839UM47_9HYPH|nr:HNH endonuclease [Phyllobacterium trifolii]MBB3149762.1 uncharacterized protein (TIGR02646 family) [Phyllobacterium trifolii]
MIRLTKLPAPQRLTDNAAAWTQTIVDKTTAGETPTQTEKSRYRHPEIKAVLVNETHGKCAYCESKLQHIHHGDVEHMFPKSLDPALTFQWENLTLACEVCNQNKSNKDPLMHHIIGPYAINPEQHLVFIGGLVFSRGTVQGTSTRALLELHRAELVEMRNYQVDRIMTVFTQIFDATLPLVVRRALYDDLVRQETCASAPYAAMARCIVRDVQRGIDPLVLEAA